MKLKKNIFTFKKRFLISIPAFCILIFISINLFRHGFIDLQRELWPKRFAQTIGQIDSIKTSNYSIPFTQPRDEYKKTFFSYYVNQNKFSNCCYSRDSLKDAAVSVWFRNDKPSKSVIYGTRSAPFGFYNYWVILISMFLVYFIFVKTKENEINNA